jgi:4-hydroxythreonine-4-phosphate dehydrogenase
VERFKLAQVKFTVFGPLAVIEPILKGTAVEIFNSGPEEIELEYGIVSASAGEAAVRAIRTATEKTRAGEFKALVTAPINKKAVSLAGLNFIGHTEMLKELCGAPEVVMMFLSRKMIIGLLTTHIALKQVPESLSIPSVLSKIRILNEELIQRLKFENPRIGLCALNPHSGEGGMFGREEVEILAPAAEFARKEGINIGDPESADALFPRVGQYSAILAVYHDQGLIPAKLAPGGSVNFTGGLPIIRTSPGHGTAFDIAGKNMADPSGMVNAIRWALKLCR